MTLAAAMALATGVQAEPSEEKAAEAVNINEASVEQLAEVLTGVGPKKAQAIVQFRAANGDFQAAADLTEVKGIGEKTLEDNRLLISL